MKKLLFILLAVFSLTSCTTFKNCNFYSSTIYTNIGSSSRQDRIAEIREQFYKADTTTKYKLVVYTDSTGYNHRAVLEK